MNDQKGNQISGARDYKHERILFAASFQPRTAGIKSWLHVYHSELLRLARLSELAPHFFNPAAQLRTTVKGMTRLAPGGATSRKRLPKLPRIR